MSLISQSTIWFGSDNGFGSFENIALCNLTWVEFYRNSIEVDLSALCFNFGQVSQGDESALATFDGLSPHKISPHIME